jgi:uncharacterized DUF497 family protein
MIYVWDEEKDKLLIRTRKVSFEQIIAAIEEGNLLAVIENPNQERYRGQSFLIVRYNDYAYIVPALIEDEGRCVLKTIYPSRKYTKEYLGGKDE